MTQIRLLLLFAISGPGLFLLLISLVMRMHKKRKIARCSASATGKVVDYYHKYTGDRITSAYVGPVVEFENETGCKYTAQKTFSGVVTKFDSRRNNLENAMWEDSKGILHVVSGRQGLPVLAMAEKLWPKGSEMTVWYDPRDPGKYHYIGTPIRSSMLQKIYLITGAAFVLIGIIVSILI